MASCLFSCLSLLLVVGAQKHAALMTVQFRVEPATSYAVRYDTAHIVVTNEATGETVLDFSRPPGCNGAPVAGEAPGGYVRLSFTCSSFRSSLRAPPQHGKAW